MFLECVLSKALCCCILYLKYTSLLLFYILTIYTIIYPHIRIHFYTGTRIHGDSPDVTFHGRTDLHFPYVPSHLSYMLLELLKNSMRATVETHGTDRMPPIRIVIADSEDNEDVSVDV